MNIKCFFMIFIKMIDDNLYTHEVYLMQEVCNDVPAIVCAPVCKCVSLLDLLLLPVLQKCITKTRTKLACDFGHIKIEQRKEN